MTLLKKKTTHFDSNGSLSGLNLMQREEDDLQEVVRMKTNEETLSIFVVGNTKIICVALLHKS